MCGFDKLFKQDLGFIKIHIKHFIETCLLANKHNESYLYSDCLFLNELFYFNKNLETIKYVLCFVKKNYPKLLSRIDNWNGGTFFTYFLHVNKNLGVIKYVFNFVKDNCPVLFFSRNSVRETILHKLFVSKVNLKIIKFVFNFVKDNCPSLFFETNYGGGTVIRYVLNSESPPIIKYVFDFYRNNFPEIIDDQNIRRILFKKNIISEYLVLPLIFQIHN